MSGYTILNGDCAKVMPTLDAESVDAIVTDPPYGLGFMGKAWDHAVPGVVYWKEALRVAKPGAHLLCFGGTRTFHRMACAIEDAGWNIKDCIMLVYGKGFPKSNDIGKSLEKRGITDRETAKQWLGWGTSLKPAWEPVIVAQKPVDGTTVNNVIEHGVGGINIDACRVPTNESWSTCYKGKRSKYAYDLYLKEGTFSSNPLGRFPANLVHDGSDEVMSLFPQAGNGSAARFFYCAKASNKDRNRGGVENDHPTVKPNDLMRWLVRLACPRGGIVLDPFMGSGSTGVACMDEGMNFVGIEMDPHFCDVAEGRITGNPKQSIAKPVEKTDEKAGQLTLF